MHGQEARLCVCGWVRGMELRKREREEHSPNRSGRLERLDKRVVRVKEGRKSGGWVGG